MKTVKLLSLAAALLATASMTSCKDDKEKNEDVLYTYTFDFNPATYNNQGYWTDVYNPDAENFFVTPTATFSHHADITEWDGVVYKSFTGFCPSRVDDTTDHSAQDWTQYQWAAAANSGGKGYLIAHWSVSEGEDTQLNDRSCAIGFGQAVQPVKMTITNTAWAYWAMKNGSAFSAAFGAADWQLLTIHGIAPDKTETTVEVYLARNGEILNKWKEVDLTGLGTVTAVYFTFASSDSGQWGMNTPAYFALQSMTINYPAQD